MEWLEDAEVKADLTALISEYRERSMWFLREDFMPSNDTEAVQVLEYIEKHADREGFKRARRLKQWFLHHTSKTSAD
ncbi:hypothetical protein ACFL4W_02185 [Planctomycetota bacterium]